MAGLDVSFFADGTYAIATVVVLSFPQCHSCRVLIFHGILLASCRPSKYRQPEKTTAALKQNMQRLSSKTTSLRFQTAQAWTFRQNAILLVQVEGAMGAQRGLPSLCAICTWLPGLSGGPRLLETEAHQPWQTA